MADLQELEVLLGRVENNDWPRDVTLYSPFLAGAAKTLGLDEDDKHGFHLALHGSIDAAVALVEKLLPDREHIKLLEDAGAWFAVIGVFSTEGGAHVENFCSNGGAAMDTPALALCAALLRALISAEEGKA